MDGIPLPQGETILVHYEIAFDVSGNGPNYWLLLQKVS